MRSNPIWVQVGRFARLFLQGIWGWCCCSQPKYVLLPVGMGDRRSRRGLGVMGQRERSGCAWCRECGSRIGMKLGCLRESVFSWVPQNSGAEPGLGGMLAFRSASGSALQAFR